MSDNLICDDPSIYTPLIKNEVIVLEDSEDAQEAIKQVMEQELHWQVTIVNNQKEAVSLAEQKKAAFYILDNRMGKTREHEGWDAAEQIREIELESKIETKAFVSIWSGYLSEKDFQRMAYNLKVKLYPKKSFKEDVRNIAHDMLNYQLTCIANRKIEIINDIEKNMINNQIDSNLRKQTITSLNELKKIDSLEKEILNKLKTIHKLEKLYHQKSFEKKDSSGIQNIIASDTNISVYDKLLKEDQWFLEYKGKYVAFIDGELIGSDEDKQKLLEQLKTLKKQDKSIFFTRVEKKPRVVDLPSSFML